MKQEVAKNEKDKWNDLKTIIVHNNEKRKFEK